MDNAHRVNRGEMPRQRHGDELRTSTSSSATSRSGGRRLAVELVGERIPQRFGLDPLHDIQVLTPMHRGELGATTLNERLQALLNPDGPELRGRHPAASASATR